MRTAQRFRKSKKRLISKQLEFDVLNIIEQVDTLYEDLRLDAELILLELANLQYAKSCIMAGKVTHKRGNRKIDYDWLFDYCLAMYDPVTKYVWDHEVDRKRARTSEAVISAAGSGKPGGKIGKYLTSRSRSSRSANQFSSAEFVDVQPNRDEMEKAIDAASKAWVRFNSQEADNITDTVTLQAYKDSGVEYVRWVTQKDEKVCSDCKELDGVVFPIDQAPSKKHWHCRCYYEPVKKK